jgi:riboflavin kinase/FMN adenylyltransferase
MFNLRRLLLDPPSIMEHPEHRLNEGSGLQRLIAIGNFDGLHSGHLALLQQLTSLQDTLEQTGQTFLKTVLSFEPHPRAFFQPKDAPLKILPLRSKVLCLKALGIDELALLQFNKTLASMSPEAFIQDILVGKLNAKVVVVGEDFHFGARRTGSVETLERLGEALGFQVKSVASVMHEGCRVSSSLLRDILQKADLQSYRRLTGRDYELSGRVVYGRQLGRTLGFPTLNIPMPDRLAIAGIFAVEVFGLSPEGVVKGVASLGRRPTVENQGRNLLEVFLFDWNQAVYGRRVCVRLKAFIRAEQKFDDLETMRLQMVQDMAQARDLLQKLNSQ